MAEVVASRPYGDGTRGYLFFGSRIPVSVVPSRRLSVGGATAVVDVPVPDDGGGAWLTLPPADEG